MNFEKYIKEVSDSNVSSLNENIFLEKLHSERRRRDSNKLRLFNGLSAGVCVLLFSFITFSQLADDPIVYVSNDLKSLESMDIETETYVYELADYLVEISDDIWVTLAFLDEINFETVIINENGGLE